MHDRKDDEMDALIQYTLKKNDKMDPNLKELSALKLTENVRQYHWHPLASDITAWRKSTENCVSPFNFVA